MCVCVCVFFCLCVLWSGLWFKVEFVGLADEMATEGRHQAEGWEQDDLHFSKGEKAQFKDAKVIVFHLSHSIPTLKTSLAIFYFSFYFYPFTESDTCWAHWAPLHKFMLMSAMKTSPHLQIFVEQRSVHFLSFFYTSLFSHFLILYPLFLLYFVFYWFIFPKPQPGTMRLSHMMWNVVSAEIINTRL